MIYVALGQLFLIAVLVGALIARERQHDAAIRWMVETEQTERDKLVQRIQHPEREPVVRSAPAVSGEAAARAEKAHEVSDEHRANLAKVGTVPLAE